MLINRVSRGRMMPSLLCSALPFADACPIVLAQKDIVASYSGSLATPSGESAPEADDMSISRVLDALLDPYVSVPLSYIHAARCISCTACMTSNRFKRGC